MALLILKNTPAGRVATLASAEEIAAGVKNKTLTLASDGLCYIEHLKVKQDYDTKEMAPKRRSAVKKEDDSSDEE